MSSQSTKVSVSTYLFLRLKEVGANHVFGIPGDYVLPLFDELIDQDHGVEHILVCNELNGAYAADGYSKMSGFGAVAVTYGVGSLSTANAVGGSFADSTPMIVIAGTPTIEVLTTPTPRKLHHVIDTNFDACLEAFRPITAASHRLTRLETASAEIDDLSRTAMQRKKPVYLEIPYDLQLAEVEKPTEPLDLWLNQSSQVNLKAALCHTVGLLNSSQTRSVVTGHLLQREKLIEETKSLVECLNASVATTFVGKIPAFEGHPNAAGMYMGAMSCDATKTTVETADLALVAGMTLNEFDTGVFTSKLGEEQDCIWMDFDQVLINNHVYDKVYLRDFLPALLKEAKNDQAGTLEISKTVRRFSFQRSDRFDPTDKNLTIDRLFVQLANYAKAGDVMFGDTGGYINASQAEYPVGVDIHGCGNYGSLGAGFALFCGGIFAKEASGRRCYMITGDGAFHMTAQELSTLIKYETDCVLFVLDNKGYGAERQIYPGKERSYNNTPVWNYEELGSAFGGVEGQTCNSFVVRTEKDMAELLDNLDKPKGVNIVRIILDPWDSASFNVKFSEALRH
ncbi:Alpha-keto-acid decarboxylase [Pseudovibrio sp. W64]|uniref:thiamine pyrophosphate-binding protein n=1 Tax=Pseudovibrio sp. W64 TaxID=1735583 RepID=UPI0007AE537A|nr:thiamine pyrophosphate-binding protein [Pseudovibrio sp. W64]KZK77853.1 Alpha-keto-acid decarboxylase [Pseudovibrio sp. W64]